MRHRMRKGSVVSLLCMMIALIAAACANSDEGGSGAKLRDISVVLDYMPNTNHTGLYVAIHEGYYEAEGLNVKLIQPGVGGADVLVASGEVPFGVSYQENVTEGRVQNVPLVSLAAVIQHNTSGFASVVEKGITRPKDFEGKVYAGWGGPAEEAVIDAMMKADGGDFSQVTVTSSGSADTFTALYNEIDFVWMFDAWQGTEARLRDIDLNIIYMNDYEASLDYYTPIIVTNEKLIAEEPELVRSFMSATAKGYDYAIAQPDAAADILIELEPDLDPELVRASQAWLSPHYQADAPQWGLQKREVWSSYAEWMLQYGLLERLPDIDAAFTNAFLPGQ